MNKVGDFFKKWGFVVILAIIAVTLLFSLGCCIYTAVINPFVGIVGIVGVVLTLVFIAGRICEEIKYGR